MYILPEPKDRDIYTKGIKKIIKKWYVYNNIIHLYLNFNIIIWILCYYEKELQSNKKNIYKFNSKIYLKIIITLIKSLIFKNKFILINY